MFSDAVAALGSAGAFHVVRNALILWAVYEGLHIVRQHSRAWCFFTVIVIVSYLYTVHLSTLLGFIA